MSDWRNLWNNERWKSYDKCSKLIMAQNGANGISEMVNIICRFFCLQNYIGSNNSLTLIENNFRFLTQLSLNSM